jgi:hypothetical protein
VVPVIVELKVRSPVSVTIAEAAATVITPAELAAREDAHVDAAEKVIAPATLASRVTRPVIPAVLVSVIVATTMIVPVDPAIGVNFNVVQVINASSSLSTVINPAVAAPRLPPRSIAPHRFVMVAPPAAFKNEVASTKTRSIPVIAIGPLTLPIVDTVAPVAMVTTPVLAPVQPTSAITLNPLEPVAMNEAVNVIVSLAIMLVKVAIDDDAVATVITPVVTEPTA